MYYISIDVSTKESALCMPDGKGKIVRETKLPTDPEIVARLIAATGLAIERIDVESGCTAPSAGQGRPVRRQKGNRAAAHAHLTECRYERKPALVVMGCTGIVTLIPALGSGMGYAAA